MNDNLQITANNFEEIELFRQYLQINTSHPTPDYEQCIAFLEEQAHDLNLQIQKYSPFNNAKQTIVLTWSGLEPNLPSILLNSHMDVVPVFEGHWSHPPFGAEVDTTGRIYARGTQDMKSVGMQYLAAIRSLKHMNIKLKRTIHVSFVPDEEIGGFDGMMLFIKSQLFQSLNIGFALDEGLASPTDVFSVFYAERTCWRVRFHCEGNSGHGSLLLKNTPGEKARIILDRFMDFRDSETKKLDENPNFKIGDVTTINLTMVDDGSNHLSNVIPSKITFGFDIRLALDVDHESFINMLNSWCEAAGENVTIEYTIKRPKVPATKIDDTNIYWTAFRSALIDDLKLKIQTEVFTGRTDSCYIRQLDIPAIGFSPIINTPILLHDHDEFIHTNTYLQGIQIYVAILNRIGNIIGQDVDGTIEKLT